MKSVAHVTTVKFDREQFVGITEAMVRQIVAQSGGTLVNVADDKPVDLTGKIDPKAVKLWLTSQIDLPETVDDIVALAKVGPETILAAVTTGIKLAANQRMQAAVKVESPAARAERELAKRRTDAFIAWGQQNPVEAFAKLQESTKGPEQARAFDTFRDELVKSQGM